MGLFDAFKEKNTLRPTFSERMGSLGYSPEETRKVVRRKEQRRQTKQLREYAKRTKRTSSILERRYDVKVPAEPEPEGRTWGLWDVFELFRVLQYPLFNMVKHIQQGSDTGEVMKSFARGMMLKERTTGDDLLEAFGMADGKGRSISGFILDIVADPLNWVGIGLATKLGRLSRLKGMGSLANLKEGSKVAQQLTKVFPDAIDLKTAVEMIPELASSWGAQAAGGTRALLSFGGKTIVRGAKTLDTLQVAHDTIMAWKPVASMKRMFTGLTNDAAKRVADVHRWAHQFLDNRFRTEAAEIMEFLETGGPEVGKLLIRMNEDPLFIAWSTIAMMDAGKIPGAGGAQAAHLVAARKAAELIVKKSTTGAQGKFHTLIRSHLKGGFTRGDVDVVMDAVEHAMGTWKTTRAGFGNKYIKEILSSTRKDAMFNPYWAESFFSVLQPDDTLRDALATIASAPSSVLSGSIADKARRAALHYDKPYRTPNFKWEPFAEPKREAFETVAAYRKAKKIWGAQRIDVSLNDAMRVDLQTVPPDVMEPMQEYLKLHARPTIEGTPLAQHFMPMDDNMYKTLDAVSRAWAKQPDATKDVFRGAVEKIYKMKHCPGPIGALIESGAEEGQVFALTMRMFNENPAHVLAQSPELFFFANEMTRFAGKGRGAAATYTGKTLRDASAIHQSSLVISKLIDFMNPQGAVTLSDDARLFMSMMSNHLVDMSHGAQVKGPYSKLYRLYLGTYKGATPTQKQLKSMFGQLRSDNALLVKALETGDIVSLRAAAKNGLLDAPLVDMLKRVDLQSRRAIAGRFSHLNKFMGEAIAGVHANDVAMSANSYVIGKAWENAMLMGVLQNSTFSASTMENLKPIGSTIADILDAVYKTPGVKVDRRAFEMAGKIGRHLKEMEKVEASLGLLRSSILKYFPHVMDTSTNRDHILTVVSAGGKFSRKLGAAKHRTILKTIEDVNSGKLAEGMQKLFVDDPALAMAIRGSMHARAVTHQDMALTLGEKFGVKMGRGATLAAKDAKKYGVIDVANMGKFKVDKEIVQYLASYQKMITSSEELAGVHKSWHELVSWYKSWTLGIFPSYHARNAVSNVSQNWLSGMRVKDIPCYHMARRIQKYGQSLTDEFMTTITGERVSLAQIAREFAEFGVEGSGAYMGEVPEVARMGAAAARVLKQAPYGGKPTAFRKATAAHGKAGYGIFAGGAQAPPTTMGKHFASHLATVTPKEGVLGKIGQHIPLIGKESNKALAMGYAVGRGIENNARGAQYIFSRLNGYSPVESGLRVAKFLFDYNDITPTVANLREIMPFILWTRKNIPLQLEHLVMRPSHLSRWVKGKDAYEDMRGTGDIDFPDLPEFIRENVPIAVRKRDDGTHEYFLLGNWLAFTDVERMFDPHDMVMNLIFPGLRVPFELAANQSLYFHTPIDRGIPGEKKKFLGMNLSPKFAHVLRSLRVLNEADRLLGLGVAGTDKDGLAQRMLRFGLGMKLALVDPEQETLRRYKKHADAIGRKLAKERYKEQR